MSTRENLWRAIEEESKNRLVYRAFAEKAEADGDRQVARLFRAIAESELIHARAELDAVGAIGSSAENLRFAVAAEEREFQDRYARYLIEAQNEGRERVVAMFGNTLKVERAHHRIFVDTLAAMLAGQALPDEPVYVCETCGNTVIGKAPGACEFCGSPAEGFREVD